MARFSVTGGGGATITFGLIIARLSVNTDPSAGPGAVGAGPRTVSVMLRTKTTATA